MVNPRHIAGNAEEEEKESHSKMVKPTDIAGNAEEEVEEEW